MYGHAARQTLIAVLKDAPEMMVGVFPNSRGKVGKPTDALLRQMADRILMELWMRGFAVSARTPSDKSPTGNRDPELHAAWRATKSKPSKDHGQTDVEARRLPP